MDLVDKFLSRTDMLLRLLDPEDLGHLVHHEARQEIQRVLRLTTNPDSYPDKVSGRPFTREKADSQIYIEN